ncbi:ParA family protein [Xenorhabdus bovienii]|uniref:ParA family protein n=1 Tax=Xenorhabdus bovienii TaxID=40576 RepID=UPI003DA4E6DB
MKTLVVAQQKGGVGKTSTLVHIAYDFFERGLKVAVIDLDTQGNASFTLKDYDSGYLASNMFNNVADNFNDVFGNISDGPLLKLIKSDSALANMERRSVTGVVANFRNKIEALGNSGFDVVLIDTAPSLGVSLATALYASDYVVSPIELEAYSIQGIGKMVTAIRKVREANPTLSFLGMVPSKVDGRNPRHSQHLAELKRAYPQLIIPAAVGLRSSIADALATGVPVWKIKKTAARKAAKEVRELANYIYEKMEIAE